MHCNTLVLSISNLPYPVWKLEGKVPHFFCSQTKEEEKCPFSSDRGQLISAVAAILLPNYNNLRMGRESGMSRLLLCWNCQMMAWRILNVFNQFRSLFLVAYLTFRKKASSFITGIQETTTLLKLSKFIKSVTKYITLYNTIDSCLFSFNTVIPGIWENQPQEYLANEIENLWPILNL